MANKSSLDSIFLAPTSFYSDVSFDKNVTIGAASISYSSTDKSIIILNNGNERVRIGINGEIGLGGANYGNTGQVLTSNGAGSAPTWQNNSSGSTFIGLLDAPASLGSAGQIVAVNSGESALEFVTPYSYGDTDVSSHLNTGSASVNKILSWNGTDFAWVDQSGSGSSSNFISVKDYGALGDGSTDDTDEIQSAIDAAFNAGGGKVFIPAGIYMIDAASSSTASTGRTKDGGLLLKPKVQLVGDGQSVTVLRNKSNNWQSMIRIGGGDGIAIRSLTIDGDSNNQTPNTLNQSTIRGEGIIVAQVNGITASAVNNLLIDDVEVINTGHYGIGIQDLSVINARLTNLTFANIGGDCIDIKSIAANPNKLDANGVSTPTPAYPKEGIIIDNIFVKDGCGHNHSSDSNLGHQNQACIDVGGTCRITNIHIEGLETYSGIGCAGVRFRAPVDSTDLTTTANRLGSEGSSASNIYVDCVQSIGSGTASADRAYGVAIHDSNITVNNVRVNQTYIGVVIENSGSGNPKYCSVNNINATNIKGNDANGRAIRIGPQQTNCAVSGIAKNCDVGVEVKGYSHTFDLSVEDCSNALTGLFARRSSGRIVNRSNVGIATYYGGSASGDISVKEYGAVGDGTTDDTSAIQAALDDPANHKAIYFPTGDYVISSSLTSSLHERKIYGEGAITATANLDKALIFNNSNYVELSLNCKGNNKINVFAQFNDCVEPYVHDCRVRDLEPPDFDANGNKIGGKAVAFEFFTDIDTGAKITDNYITNLNANGDEPNGTFGRGMSRGVAFDSSVEITKPIYISNNVIDGVIGEEGDAISVMCKTDAARTPADPTEYPPANLFVTGNYIKDFNRRACKIKHNRAVITNNTFYNTWTSSPGTDQNITNTPFKPQGVVDLVKGEEHIVSDNKFINTNYMSQIKVVPSANHGFQNDDSEKINNFLITGNVVTSSGISTDGSLFYFKASRAGDRGTNVIIKNNSFNVPGYAYTCIHVVRAKNVIVTDNNGLHSSDLSLVFLEDVVGFSSTNNNFLKIT